MNLTIQLGQCCARDPNVLAWIRANGIDPDVVLLPNTVVISGNVFQLDVCGGSRLALDPETGQVRRVRLSFDHVHPWPWPTGPGGPTNPGSTP